MDDGAWVWDNTAEDGEVRDEETRRAAAGEASVGSDQWLEDEEQWPQRDEEGVAVPRPPGREGEEEAIRSAQKGSTAVAVQGPHELRCALGACLAALAAQWIVWGGIRE